MNSIFTNFVFPLKTLINRFLPEKVQRIPRAVFGVYEQPRVLLCCVALHHAWLR